MQSLFTDQFLDALDECRRLYVDLSIECFVGDPARLGVNQESFFADLQHRFACMVIKAFVETAESDLVWSHGEAVLAIALVEHLLRKPVKESKLQESFDQLSTIAHRNSWEHVLEPMTWFEELKEHFEELKTAIIRVANIAAKVDGKASPETMALLRSIRWQLDQHLKTPIAEEFEATDELLGALAPNAIPTEDLDPDLRLSDVLIQLVNESDRDAARGQVAESPNRAVESASKSDLAVSSASESDPPTDEQRAAQLEKAMEELDALIGINDVKHEVRTLVNLCKLKKHREAHGMPTSSMSLHMVFTGNPGTGKTTVARIMGKLLGAMGILQRGHLVETDRGGLVAEFLGQTAQKTEAKIDEALDGVLFIDEAYSLSSSEQADTYGLEAIQTMLKRMEDDRDRLVVILAGYPEPMESMLKSNPGLSSRFSRNCHFPDYASEELCAIFEKLAEHHHYHTTNEFRAGLLQRVNDHVAKKDEHFGNGRLIRNIFEHTIRNLANRVVSATELNPDLLSTFQPEDLTSSSG